MNLEKMMETYKRENSVTPREEKILETIQKSKEIVMEVQSENTMSYTEFLFSQFRLIRKRWWMLQAMLLVLVFLIMPSLKDTTYFMRMLGVASVFFIVMIIPEFWRNKESNSCQIEIILGTRIYVQILVLQGFVELSDVVKSGGIYSVRNAFATRLQQKYLKNIGHFSVIGTGECPFCYADFVSAVTLPSFSKVLLIASTRTCISK